MGNRDFRAPPLRPFSFSAFPSLVSPSRRRASNGYTSRSIIRDFVEHTIPRESFTYAPPGNAVVAEKSNQTRAQDPRVLPAGPKLPVLGGNERGGTRPHAQRGNDPAYRATVKVHSIFKCCGDITQSAAFSMRSHCPVVQSYAPRLS